MKIIVNGLTFAYGSRGVLQIKGAEFKEGKAYGIVGKNGVGKTTFFKCITNIIASYSGQIMIDGLDVKTNLSVLKNVGIVLDDMSLYNNRTGMFNLRYFAGLRGEFDIEHILDLARELELDSYLDIIVDKYSLGMKKKMQLLVSLMNNAEVLIFDEPFRGLDATTVEWFRNYLNDLKSRGRTILISSHVQEDIESVSDYVCVMHRGDFVNTFDLKDMTQNFIYTVEVDNRDVFLRLLESAGIPYSTKKYIQFAVDVNTYNSIFKQAVAQDVAFLQVRRDAMFADHLSKRN